MAIYPVLDTSTFSQDNIYYGKVSDKEKWGNFLKYMREKRGYTLAQLASIVGVSPQAISQLEKAKRSPSGELAFELSRALNFYYDFMLPRFEPGDYGDPANDLQTNLTNKIKSKEEYDIDKIYYCIKHLSSGGIAELAKRAYELVRLEEYTNHVNDNESVPEDK